MIADEQGLDAFLGVCREWQYSDCGGSRRAASARDSEAIILETAGSLLSCLS